jgi:hypothetical protein
MSLKINGRKTKVDDSVIIDRMIEDLRESDSDTLCFLIEKFYPVKATYDQETGEVEIVSEDENLNLNDIF